MYNILHDKVIHHSTCNRIQSARYTNLIECANRFHGIIFYVTLPNDYCQNDERFFFAFMFVFFSVFFFFSFLIVNEFIPYIDRIRVKREETMHWQMSTAICINISNVWRSIDAFKKTHTHTPNECIKWIHHIYSAFIKLLSKINEFQFFALIFGWKTQKKETMILKIATEHKTCVYMLCMCEVSNTKREKKTQRMCECVVLLWLFLFKMCAFGSTPFVLPWSKP